MSADPAAPRPQTKPFTAFVQEIRKGALAAELSEALAQVAAAVVTHGKKGTLTVKFDLKPEGDNGAITVQDSYVSKPPTPPARPALFFADTTGQISRNRLDQPELPLREIAGGKSNDSTAPGEGATAS